MKKNVETLILLIIVLQSVSTFSLSMVYNFRMAQITRQPIGEHTDERPNSISALFFDYFQKMKNFDFRENYAGAITTYTRDIAKKTYFRTDCAVAHVHQSIDKKTTANLTEIDDILFTAGHNLIVKKNQVISVSALFGIPTHDLYTIQRVGLGLAQVGLGIQLDGIHKFKRPIDFLWGTRYNYFVPRNGLDIHDTSYKFSIGSIADLLIALQSRTVLSHGIEGGYSARWGFGASATPTIAKLDAFSYMRNSFYLVYKYTFLTNHVAHRFLLNIGYGFDSKPKLYGFNAVMVWAAWGIAF